jgi:diguanylate cyclase (GGDEF)-like protein
MSDARTSNSNHSPHANDVALVGTVLLGLVLSAALVASESSQPHPSPDWVIIGTLGALLLVCERTPRAWIPIAGGSTVTPLLTFAYALALLGSPSLALALALVGNLVHSSTLNAPPRSKLFSASRTMVAVASGGLVLMALDARGSVTQFDRVPWRWSLAIVLAGVALLVLDALVTEIAVALGRNTSFIPALRRGLGVRLTAVGSLLSLAPIWVIGANSSVVLIPLLGITTILVFASTRRALEGSHEAQHDALTKLANRRSFAEQLADASSGVGAAGTGVLLLMDLDGFKDVNDRLGHDVGDAVLVAFAERLAASIPPNAYAARLGGDEFAVLMTWSKRDADTETVVLELHRRLSEPLVVGGFPVSVGVSIGAAHMPADGRSEDELMRAADIAMYRSKRLGTSVERFQHDAGAIQTGRLGLLRDLSTAVRDNELRVDYQPQLSMLDGRIVAVEALVRWQHPRHGTIAPNDFIGLAEHTDLIGPITESVMRVATGGLLMTGSTEARLAINASVRNLQDPQFAPRTLQLLKDTGFPAGRLELELTERALVTNPERTRDTIAELRAAGVRITVDGFGTGYASYHTLRTLNVDRIKIDRDFIVRILHDANDKAIVRSVIGLAHTLGLEVIAEGVEANETWDLLAEMGCDAAQGFGIALPMPLVSLGTWMAQWHQASTGST